MIRWFCDVCKTEILPTEYAQVIRVTMYQQHKDQEMSAFGSYAQNLSRVLRSALC